VVTDTRGAWANRYREKWTWDKVTFGSHSVDCYPGGCSWRVYTKGDKIVREEQSSVNTPTEPGIPDMNPMGCQKGACWSHCHYSPDRVTEPLKRVGERGKGQFEPVSWDEALTDIADAMLDAIEDQGVESIITPLTPRSGRERPASTPTRLERRPPMATRSSRTSVRAGTSPGVSTTRPRAWTTGSSRN
jgi:anaerobic selenocysteine-containing dehydrogenase